MTCPGPWLVSTWPLDRRACSPLLVVSGVAEGGRVLFVGDDWAEDHHDVEFVDEGGRRLARARLAEGLEGLSGLHALIGEHSPEEWAELPPEEATRRVVIGIETDRGRWVQALLAAGYVVFAVNPRQVARYRERHSSSGANSDAGDAHVLAEIVRLDREHHRPGRRRQPGRRGCQAAGPDAPEHDLGPDSAGAAAAAQCACPSSSRPRWRPSTICPRRTPSSCWVGRRTPTARPGCPAPSSPRRCAGPTAGTSRASPRSCTPCCGPRRCGNR